MEYIITFSNTNTAIMAERVLLRERIDISVMPLPSSIGSGCGITLRVVEELLNKTLDILKAEKLAVLAVFSRVRITTGYQYKEQMNFREESQLYDITP